MEDQAPQEPYEDWQPRRGIGFKVAVWVLLAFITLSVIGMLGVIVFGK